MEEKHIKLINKILFQTHTPCMATDNLNINCGVSNKGVVWEVTYTYKYMDMDKTIRCSNEYFLESVEDGLEFVLKNIISELKL